MLYYKPQLVKRIFVMVMLAIHLFNMGGYILLEEYQEYRTDKRMNSLISSNLYNPNTLIELKIKQNLPGITEWSDFKNVTGQVQLKNACYNYVKLRFTKDTLYVMCVPNYEKTRLVSHNVIYAKQINDIPQDKNSSSSALKKAAAEVKYNSTQPSFSFISFEDAPEKNASQLIAEPCSPFIPAEDRPPAVLSLS